MKVELQKKISFFELNSRFELRLKGLLNYMQEAAAFHSEQAGHGTCQLMEQGNAWVLHRIGMTFHRIPVFGDDLRIVTWHQGAKGFRAYRDFEIFCGSQKIVSATTVWFFIDLHRKKILKIPKDIAERYTLEKDQAWDTDINAWNPDLELKTEPVVQIQTRPSDYDPLGHVNNALYFDYLETLITRGFPDNRKIQTILMQFNKEIATAVSNVDVGLKHGGDLVRFMLSSPGCVHAVGEFRYFS